MKVLRGSPCWGGAGFSCLRGSAEQQSPGVCGGGAVRGGLVIEIGMVLSGAGPAAVVQGLFWPWQVRGQGGTQRAGPGHISVGEQGGRVQAAQRLPRQEPVGGPGQDDDAGQAR